MAAYGLRSPGDISPMGSSCRTRWPAAASQRQNGPRSPISPMPRSCAERSAKSGTRTPAARRVPSALEAAAGDTVLAAEVGDAEHLPGEAGRLPEQPEGGLGADLRRLPVGLVELGRVVD